MNTFVVYDPQANTWTELASIGTGRNGHTSAAIRGKLYVFAGVSPDGRTASVEAYDPLANTWEQVSGMTGARHGCRAVAL